MAWQAPQRASYKILPRAGSAPRAAGTQLNATTAATNGARTSSGSKAQRVLWQRLPERLRQHRVMQRLIGDQPAGHLGQIAIGEARHHAEIGVDRPEFQSLCESQDVLAGGD